MAQLKSRYDYLYLSPHFDDVALSCGGQVFLHSAAAESVLVVTMTGAEPPDDLRSDTVASLHRRWAGSLGGQMTGSIVAARRAEDREALAALGADAHHLPFLDCIYRRSPKSGNLLYPGPDDMFGELNPEDSEIFGSLAAAFAALPAAGQVLLPLTVGGHVDHRILRVVGETVFSDVAYYEDYPYVMTPDALEAVLPPDEREGWRAETIWLTEAALEAKIEAVAAYRSQLSSFFAGRDDLSARLREEGVRVMAGSNREDARPPSWAIGAERLWRSLPRFSRTD